jgi:hypothetical protein
MFRLWYPYLYRPVCVFSLSLGAFAELFVWYICLVGFLPLPLINTKIATTGSKG